MGREETTYFSDYNFLIVVTHPLVALKSERTHSFRVWFPHLPAVEGNGFTNLEKSNINLLVTNVNC